MGRKKKGKSRAPRRPPDVPHEATAEELAERAHKPLTAVVCGTCGWIYVQAGRTARRTCTKTTCRSTSVRRYRGESLDELASTVIPAETRHEDPIGDQVYIRRRFVGAYERFIQHQDQWMDATTLAKEIAGPQPSRALIAKIYRDLTAKQPSTLERPSPGGSRSTRRSRRKAARRPKLEELEHERREAEREKVRGMKKGTIRKKLLK